MSTLSDSTFSLYFGLRDGRRASLEIVSQASIEWVNSVRLSAKMIDPRAEIKIEFVSAHEGSLSINTILDWGEEQLERLEETEHPRLAKYAVALAVFLILELGPATDYWFGAPDQLELSDEDRAVMDKLLERISQSEELQNSNKRFFNVLQHDRALESVGVCDRPGTAPVFTVPRSQFGERSGLWQQEESPLERTSERMSDVVLETADLSTADRKWRFLDTATGKHFTANMRDEDFVQSLAEGRVKENLRMGIEMTIHIRFKERRDGSEWKSVPSTIEVIKVTLR